MVYGTSQMLTRLPNDFCLSLLENYLIPGGAVKDLGLTYGRNLSFNDHIVKVTALCMSTLGVKNVFNSELLTIFINALVFSKLFYYSSVWLSISGKNIKKLQYIQIFAARIISSHSS